MSSPKESWVARLFSGSKKEAEATSAAAHVPHQPHKETTAEQRAAMDVIARKSALVRTSCTATAAAHQQHRATDLMGELADDFLRLKDVAVPPATSAPQEAQAQQ